MGKGDGDDEEEINLHIKRKTPQIQQLKMQSNMRTYLISDENVIYYVSVLWDKDHDNPMSVPILQGLETQESSSGHPKESC